MSYEWVKGDIQILEYKIGPEIPAENGVLVKDEKNGPERDDGLDRFECSCVFGPSAQAFLAQLDKAYGFESWAARTLETPNKPGPELSVQVGFKPSNSF